MGTTSEGSDSPEVLSSLKQLEDRIARIEELLRLNPEVRVQAAQVPQKELSSSSEESEEALEIQIGQTLFARVGILVLAIGMAFLLTFPFQGLPAAVPSLFGYILVAGAWLLSYRWREVYPQLAHYILAGALVMLYFTTLRLFFFSANPAVENIGLEVALLLLVVGISLFVAVRERSQYLTGIALTAGYLTALVGNEALSIFIICAALCAVLVFFARRNGWFYLLVYGTAVTYLTHLAWAMSNPVMGNNIQLISLSPVIAASLLACTFLLASGCMTRRTDHAEEGTVIIGSIVNGLGGYAVYSLLSLRTTNQEILLYHGVASLVYLILCILFWVRERSKYSTFVYAMLGYMALSVAIIATVTKPNYFVWLAWQSIVVISTAVWFRSRFIIAANFVIFLVLFFAYLVVAGRVSLISVSFGLVALLSARVLNWKKDRLELRTDKMRIAYLASAFFIIPYALYHAIPAAYVSISWVVVALFYYVMSVILKNRKYRWMALLTFCMTIGYVFLVDMVKLDPAFRIVSFLVLGIALIWIAILYARKRPARAATDPGLSKEVNHIFQEP
jgi:uncharacterized membrane protein